MLKEAVNIKSEEDSITFLMSAVFFATAFTALISVFRFLAANQNSGRLCQKTKQKLIH